MKSRVLIAMIGVGALSVLIPLAASCGGGSSHTQNTVGPAAIINGVTLATVNSNWAAQNCSVKVELAANGEFRSDVRDTSGITTSSSGTWTPSGANSANTTGGGAWVDQLTNISGSTSSRAFSAGVGVYDTYQQNLGTCSFTLQSGALP